MNTQSQPKRNNELSLFATTPRISSHYIYPRAAKEIKNQLLAKLDVILLSKGVKQIILEQAEGLKAKLVNNNDKNIILDIQKQIERIYIEFIEWNVPKTNENWQTRIVSELRQYLDERHEEPKVISDFAKFVTLLENCLENNNTLAQERIKYSIVSEELLENITLHLRRYYFHLRTCTLAFITKLIAKSEEGTRMRNNFNQFCIEKSHLCIEPNLLNFENIPAATVLMIITSPDYIVHSNAYNLPPAFGPIL
jgi:hypothetical protein